jgi:hypothetical protein
MTVKKRLFPLYILSIALILSFGCGGAQTAPTAVPKAQDTSREEGEETEDEMEVAGIMGTIPTHLIQERLQPKLTSFQNCLAQRSQEVEFIAGRIELYFRVRLDGSVRAVFPRGSTVGDREAERCIVDIASRTRFPSPRGGGEAEFAWQFEVDPPQDIRQPVAWESERVATVVRDKAVSLNHCRKNAHYTVTAYVAPGGTVIAAGVAASASEGPDSLDCVVNEVHSWTMPDPGSYPAKVTFRIP